MNVYKYRVIGRYGRYDDIFGAKHAKHGALTRCSCRRSIMDVGMHLINPDYWLAPSF